MDFNEAKKYLLAKPESEESYPFYPDTPVFKLKGKIFAILSTDEGKPRLNLKCDPDQALALRDIFDGVIPGYHMNKKHWNTLLLQSDIPEPEIERMIDHSYQLIFDKLPKATQKLLKMQGA